MRFIEITRGTSIKIDAIISFETVEGGRTRVNLEDGASFEANMPYDSFKKAVEAGQNRLSKQLETISRQIGTPTP